MSLKQKIKDDVVGALKAKDANASMVLRMAQASVGTKEKEKRYKISKEKPELAEEELITESQLSDDEVISVISSEIKKRKDAIALYEQGNRPELVQKEKAEMLILQKYLPEQLAPDVLKKIIEESIAKVGATTIKDMGKVMGDLMPRVKGKADTGEISRIIKELLGK